MDISFVGFWLFSKDTKDAFAPLCMLAPFIFNSRPLSTHTHTQLANNNRASRSKISGYCRAQQIPDTGFSSAQHSRARALSLSLLIRKGFDRQSTIMLLGNKSPDLRLRNFEASLGLDRSGHWYMLCVGLLCVGCTFCLIQKKNAILDSIRSFDWLFGVYFGHGRGMRACQLTGHLSPIYIDFLSVNKTEPFESKQKMFLFFFFFFARFSHSTIGNNNSPL